MITPGMSFSRNNQSKTTTAPSTRPGADPAGKPMARDLSFLNEMPRLDPNSSNSLLREFSYRSMRAAAEKLQQQHKAKAKQEEQQQQEKRKLAEEENDSTSKSTKKQKTTQPQEETAATMQDLRSFFKQLADSIVVDTDDLDNDANPYEPTPLIPTAVTIPNFSMPMSRR